MSLCKLADKSYVKFVSSKEEDCIIDRLYGHAEIREMQELGMANHRKKRNRKKTNKSAFSSVAVIVLILVGVLGFRCFGLWQQNKAYAAKEEALNEEIATEEERSEELSDYEEYVGTDDYIIEMARKKLGLVFDGEIIFRQSEE